jgi:succinate dehydrogenase / fumarate reductase flavoprotein subunit
MTPKTNTNLPEFETAEKEVTAKLEKLFNIKGRTPVDHFHKKLGAILWDHVGMSRNESGLKKAIQEIQKLRKEFYADLLVPGELKNVNPELEKAGRVADFLELGELLARDALNRKESCGGHFREESATEEGEAKRDDEHFAYVAAWEYKGVDAEPVLHKEELVFETIALTQRSYK